MTSQSRQDVGAAGEAIAAHYLQAHGLEIVERNYRCRHGEIDIVAREGNALVFVEVRTRIGRSFGTPQESITAHKRARLIASAETYLQTHPQPSEEWRIDLVAVTAARRGALFSVEHLRAAIGGA